MAVTLITSITRYQGLSSDTKPTTGVNEGSKFFETDTGLSYTYDGSSWVEEGGLPALSSTTGVSSANAAQTLTVAAGGAGVRNYAKGLEVAIRGAAAGADINITLKDGATVLWREVIGNAAPRGERVGVMFPDRGLKGSANTAMTLEVEAGGASVVTVANLAYYSA